MSSDTFVYVPAPPDVKRRATINTRLDTLQGATIGLLSNWKPNADVLLKEVGRLLQERHGVGEVIFEAKHNYAMPAPISMLDDLATSCDAVLTAVGDCGSCTSWCVNDGFEIEQRGTPALSFVAKPFLVLANYELESLGLPDLALGELSRYPLSGLEGTDIHDLATNVLDQVVMKLTTTAAPVGA